jgi:hypothetical protein
MHEPTQNCRDDVEQYAENRVPQRDGERTGGNALFHQLWITMDTVEHRQPRRRGQVVTLRVPSERLREVNVAIEKTAWGGYRTEFYPTYDYRAIAEDQRAKNP